MCIKLQTTCLSYTIQTFGEFKNRHIHRSGPPLFGALTASACLLSSRFTSLSMRRPPGSRRAQFGDNRAPTLPHFHRRPPVPLQDCNCVLHYRHQKHHNSIDITGAHAPTTEPQPRLSSFFARRLLNQTVTKPCALSLVEMWTNTLSNWSQRKPADEVWINDGESQSNEE